MIIQGPHIRFSINLSLCESSNSPKCMLSKKFMKGLSIISNFSLFLIYSYAYLKEETLFQKHVSFQVYGKNINLQL